VMTIVGDGVFMGEVCVMTGVMYRIFFTTFFVFKKFTLQQALIEV